jgi:hypothetical protein
MLATGEPVGPLEAFLIDRELPHLHPAPDYSLHAMLPLELAQAGPSRTRWHGEV